MRLSSWSVILLPLTLTACEPTVGGTCSSSDEWKCKSATETWACVNGKWATMACAGPNGCKDTTVYNCDSSIATAGTACPPTAQGQLACQTIPPALLTCAGGTWVQSQPCGVCSVARGSPECSGGNTGGGGGSTGGGGGATGGGGGTTGGGGGATTGGGGGTTGGGGGTTGGGGGTTCGPGNCAGCCANGQCMPSSISGTATFCGTNGAACDDCGARGQRCENFVCVNSTSCNPTTCPNGCCANGQCFNAPLNSTANFCGRGGNACADCGRLGLVCNASFTCAVSGTGGGGGTTGGGGGTTGGGGGATGGGGGVTGGGGGTDPCQGVPIGGQCVTSSLVQYCSIPTGNGSPTVQTYQCPGGSTCQATGAGAACVQTGSCVQNDTRCMGPNTIQQCTAQGTWGATQTCSGPCQATAIGADCMLSVATTAVSGTLRYETRNPRADLTDWDVAVVVPARNVLVISQRTSGSTSTWIDATTTDANGNFTIKVPTTPGSGDSVLFAAIGGDGLGIRYLVGDPGLGTGTFSPGQQGTTRYWTWSRTASSLTNGTVITVTQAQGSGALNIYDLLQGIWTSSVTANQGKQGFTLGMWMGIGTEWSCGACFSQDNVFETGIWMPGGAQDQGYWSDYTIAHELGHWQMASYGTSPNEGGTHYIMCPTFPGQAWSEGYATWHSAAVRNEPFLEDKQGGGFFWFDISSRTYYPQSSQPSPINGPGGTNLLAEIDENAVSSILWSISTSRATGTREIFNAVASEHMNTSPWPRSYTRHTWSVGNGCTKTNVVDTRQASLHLADLLDALSCGGNPTQSNRMPATNLLRACSSPPTTTNGSYYPYPTTTPICRGTLCYGCRSGSTCSAGNTTAACGTGGVACVQCVGGQSCVNGVCQ